MEEDMRPTEEQFESGEAREAEGQALDDATYEPGAYVERTSDFKQSEDIQANLVAVTENATAEVDDPDQWKTARDPLTGKGGEDQPTDSESKDLEPTADLGTGDQTELAIPGPSTKTVEREPGSTGADVGNIDGNEPVYEMDRDASSDVREKIDRGEGKLEGETGQIGPQRIGDGQVPREKNLPLGMEKGSTKTKPGTPGGSSGGGPPVKGRGGGAMGKPKEGDGFHSGSSTVGHWLDMKGMASGKNYVEEPDGKGTWVRDDKGDWWYQEADEEEAPAERPPQGDPIDGDQPLPYTDSGGGGEKPDPDKPRGGLDREASKVYPVLGGAGGESGGRTPGDKDGEDDSGKFLGDPDLTGGLDLGDPDFPDYYTPNVIEEAQKAKRSGRK